MKKILFAFVVVLFAACSKEEMPVYADGVSYVQFENSYTDSTNVSFVLYPTENTHVVPLALKLAGKPLEQNTEFTIQLVEGSTGTEAHYDLPEKIEFRANQATDTILLTLNKVDGLDKTPVRLVFEIQGKGNLLAGQTIYTRKIIWLSNIIAQPSWWDKDFDRSFLGPYSDKKFTEFIRITKQGDLEGMEADRIRALCLEFKAELVRLKNIGEPILEDDGSDMLDTIPLLG